MTNNAIIDRLAALRQEMKNQGVDAFIIPGTDPHMSEYIADCWKCREWISGFDGSAGTVAVTLTDAGLWTDSRYFLQGAIQLEGTTIDLYKEGLPGTPSIEEHFIATLPAGSTVAVDGNLFGIAAARALKNRLEAKGLKVRTNFYPFDLIWADRPARPQDQVFVYPDAFAGESVVSKRGRILAELEKAGANAILIPALDDIAWTLNLRGTDVECNPVAICFVFLSEKENIVFIDKEKLTEEACQHFRDNGIMTAAYDKLADFLAQLPAGYRLLLDPAKVNDYLYNATSAECHKVEATSPIALLKSVKNPVEVDGFRSAMVKDGVALVRFFRWLEEAIPSGEVSERTVAEKLVEFRSQQPLYFGESFTTICGYRGHGAIVHYHATPESNATIHNEGFLLIDSGAQYFDGTTDITRTVILGTPTETEKRDFTLVLKGHINLGMAVYPEGTRGDQLDILARRALWDHHLNYLHGTGHGIGHFLNVHEGPQSIRLNHNPVTLQPGMITSNEPGLYITDQYGIRHENLVLTVENGEGEFGKFYAFETLTLFPFDLKGINPALLSEAEIEWLNQYHKNVYDKLSPNLNDEEKAWLAAKTQAIG